MITTVMIDHHEWRDWRNEGAEGAIGKLNQLLLPHGVQIAVTSEPADWVELKAYSVLQPSLEEWWTRVRGLDVWSSAIRNLDWEDLWESARAELRTVPYEL